MDQKVIAVSYRGKKNRVVFILQFEHFRRGKNFEIGQFGFMRFFQSPDFRDGFLWNIALEKFRIQKTQSVIDADFF